MGLNQSEAVTTPRRTSKGWGKRPRLSSEETKHQSEETVLSFNNPKSKRFEGRRIPGTSRDTATARPALPPVPVQEQFGFKGRESSCTS